MLSSLYPDTAERGMVVTIYLDDNNKIVSTPAELLKLEGGRYGPFYS